MEESADAPSEEDAPEPPENDADETGANASPTDSNPLPSSEPVAEPEAKPSEPALATETSSGDTPTPSALATPGSLPAFPDISTPRGGPKVRVGAFGDFSLLLADNWQHREVQLGEFVVHSNALISQTLSTFVEVGFQPAGTPSVHVHRLLFRWETSDSWRLTAGRYHLPLTWWNSTFHHGVWLQTTVDRPRGNHIFSHRTLPNDLRST